MRQRLPHPFLAAALFAVPTAATARFPSELFGQLFEAVQERGLFRDSKTFADATPKQDPATILAEWRKMDVRDEAALRAFVARHFDVPAEDVPLSEPSAARPPIVEHITSL